LHLTNALSTSALLISCVKRCSYYLKEFNSLVKHSVDDEEIFDILMLYTSSWVFPQEHMLSSGALKSHDMKQHIILCSQIQQCPSP